MLANHLITIARYYRRMTSRRVAAAFMAIMIVNLAASLLDAADSTDATETDTFSSTQIPTIEDSVFSDPKAAAFDEWETLVPDNSQLLREQPDPKPIDWIRHFGFRHSSTHGRHVGKGLPLEGTSVMNRPNHFDWFVGPLLGDDLIKNRVSQGNVLLGGIRLGWDFDYYWGVEWRFGWADPKANFASPEENSPNDVSYVVSDIDLVYYPWGDSKVRPYFLVGLGATQLDFMDENALKYNTTLATLPFGGGIQFRQASWLTWRIEILDNLSFGDDRVATMNNVSITAGMELRFGAKPSSYWPWRSSRMIW